MTTPPHSTWQWQRLSKQRIAYARMWAEPCCLCGRQIDYDLKGSDPWGPTCEHVRPLSMGGALLPPMEDLRVAHRRCQSRQGGYLAARAPRPPKEKKLRPFSDI